MPLSDGYKSLRRDKLTRKHKENPHEVYKYGFDGASVGSMYRKLMAEDYVIPGKTRAESLKIFREYMVNAKMDELSMEQWYNEQVREEEGQMFNDD